MIKPHRSTNSSTSKNFASSANTAYRYTDKGFSGLFKWATTDHYGTARSIINMPAMGFKDTCTFILIRLLIGIAGALLSGLFALFLITTILPALLGAMFL